jgi:hypothetical protein
MIKPEPATVTTLRQQEVLNELQEGVRTWAQLRDLTKINDDMLGFMLAALLNQRKIWTTIQRNEVRVYGLERRTGLVPRLSYTQRRSTDRIDTAKERRAR